MTIPKLERFRDLTVTPNCDPPSETEASAAAHLVKMLIFFQNGEERLLSFPLPKENCMLYEVLEQFNVPFTEDTRIQCVSPNSGICSEIDYFVSVGCTTDIEELLKNHPLLNEIKMVIFIPNRKERLITFTLPNESCMLNEILEQFNIPFTEDTNIQCVRMYPNSGVNIDIDYFVSVGFTTNLEDVLKNHPLLNVT